MTVKLLEAGRHAADPCPECGYDRRGGVAGAACSECGYRQPADEFVAWGKTKSLSRPAWVASLPWLLFLPAFVVLEKALPDGVVKNLLPPLLMLAFFGGVSAWQRTRPRPDGAGPQQLRLSPRGFAVRDGYGPVVYKPWKSGHRVRLRETVGGSPEVVVERPFVGRIVLAQPLAFRAAAGEARVVARRIGELLRDCEAKPSPRLLGDA